MADTSAQPRSAFLTLKLMGEATQLPLDVLVCSYSFNIHYAQYREYMVIEMMDSGTLSPRHNSTYI